MGIQSTEKIKVLVVDDNESICQLLDATLSEEGYEVDCVMRGDDGVEMATDNQYHIVMLDLMLPGMHGIDVLREVRAIRPRTDVIMMTSSATLETAVEALRLGAQDYLFKPFENIDMVIQVVQRTLEKRRLMDENERLHKELAKKALWLERTVERLSSLNEMGHALNAMLDLNNILDYLIHTITAKLGARRASLMLYNTDTGRFELKASLGIEADREHLFSFFNGEGIAGRVTEEGRPLLVEDVATDSRFVKQWERGYMTDSFISVPLILGIPIREKPEVIGVINVNDKISGAYFSLDDMQIVLDLAGQSALAIGKLHAANKELKNSQIQTIMALAEALEARDSVSGSHSDRITRHVTAMGEKMGLDEREKEILNYGAALHDIGKIGICDSVLTKPGLLDKEEYDRMKDHSRIGAEMVRGITFLEPVAPIIRSHHEMYDGTGYPDGLKGEEIPLQARIIAVLDAYDAMTSDRPYRPGQSPEWAIGVISRYSGSQFDPRVVEAFVAVLREEAEGEEVPISVHSDAQASA